MRVSVTSRYEYLRMCHLLHVHIWVSSILFRLCIIIAQVSMGKWNAMSYSWDGMHVILLCHYRCIMFSNDLWRCLLLHDASTWECVVNHIFRYDSHQYYPEFVSQLRKYSWRNGIRWGTHDMVSTLPANVSFTTHSHLSLINTIPSLYRNCPSIHGEMECDEVLMRWYTCNIPMSLLAHHVQ